MKTFITSHFPYCPLTWMFHSRNKEHRIKKIQTRALKLGYNDIDLRQTHLIIEILYKEN